MTCAFCHANWDHLSSNLFMLFVFGRVRLVTLVPVVSVPAHSAIFGY